MIKDLFIKKSIFSFSYLLFALIIEIVLFICVGLGVGPSYFFIDFILALCMALFIFAMPSFMAEAVIAIIALFIQIAISAINEALLRMSNMVFSLSMLNLAKEVGGVFTSNFVNWGLLYGLVLFWGGIIFFYVYLLKTVPTYRATRKNQWIIFLIFIILAQNTLGVSTFGINSVLKATFSSKNEDYTLWSTQYNSKKTYKKFGYFGYYYRNVGIFLDNIFQKKNSEPEVQEDVSALDYYYIAGGMSSSDYNATYTGALKDKNIVLIVIESGEWYGINQEYTPTLYAMANQGIMMTNYYARDKTNHSEALAILGSYPVTRSISPSIGDSEGLLKNNFAFTLPNILGNNGYTTHYFHANDGDFYNRKNSFTSLYGFDTATFLEDMPLLKGYSNKNSFYDFDKDSEVIKNYSDLFTSVSEEKNKFFTMQMTLLSHGNYEDLIRFGDYKYLTEDKKKIFSDRCTVKNMESYYELIDGYPHNFVEGTIGIDENNDNLSMLSDKERAEVYLRYKRYQAGLTDLDVGINALIRKLETTGELKDTAFVFYADHSAYYNNQNYLLKNVPLANGYDTTLYNIPFFIWNGGSMALNVEAIPIEGYESISYLGRDSRSHLKAAKIDKFCNTFDVLPTLLQLTGFSYNKHLYQGSSVFSTEISTFVSRESGVFRDNVYYDGITFYVKDRKTGELIGYDYEEYLLNDQKVEDIEAFIPNANGYYSKQAYLEMMYDSDYFAFRSFEDGYKLQNGMKITFIQKV